MGPRLVDEAALFYEFSLERHVPATHVLRSIDRFVGGFNWSAQHTNLLAKMECGP